MPWGIAAAMVVGSVISSAQSSSAANSAARQNRDQYEKDLAYKMWADKENARQQKFQNEASMWSAGANLAGQMQDNAMQGAQMAALYGAPGQAVNVPQFDYSPLLAAFPETPEFGEYPGFQGLTSSEKALAESRANVEGMYQKRKPRVGRKPRDTVTSVQQ